MADYGVTSMGAPTQAPRRVPTTGTLTSISDDEMKLQQLEDRVIEIPGEDAAPEFENALSSYVHRRWHAALMAKDHIEDIMLENLRQRQGEYSQSRLAEIQQFGGSEIYMMLTNVKCRAAEAWIKDIVFSPGERPWGIDATPVPEMPYNVEAAVRMRVQMQSQTLSKAGYYPSPEETKMRLEEVKSQMIQKARDLIEERTGRAEDKIDDMLVEGDFYEELEKAITDIVTFPACIVKGPIAHKRMRLDWMESYETGEIRAKPVSEVGHVYYTVNPLDFYPAPDARNCQDGDMFERVKIRTNAIFDFIGVEGFREDAIRQALDQYGESGYNLNLSDDQQRNRLEGRFYDEHTVDRKIDLIEAWMTIPGAELKRWGVKGVEDDNKHYPVVALLINKIVIMVKLNQDPLARNPYDADSFERVNNQIWGRAIPQIIKPLQEVCNACARAIVNNLAISSGPQVMVNASRIAEGENIEDMYPWKVWQYREGNVPTSMLPIQFFQPNNVSKELMQVFEFYTRLADEYSGVPAYSYGTNTTGSGAMSTATGFGMLMNQAARGIKNVISHLDNIIERKVNRTFELLMVTDPDSSWKFDLKIRAKGAIALFNKENMTIRRAEFLAATANPLDVQLMGNGKGRAYLLRKHAGDLGFDPDKIVPSEEQAAMLMLQNQENQTAGSSGVPQAVQTTPDGRKAGGADIKAVA